MSTDLARLELKSNVVLGLILKIYIAKKCVAHLLRMFECSAVDPINIIYRV